eukprot:365390-Chlamydomonas_euryale.AAC.1
MEPCGASGPNCYGFCEGCSTKLRSVRRANRLLLQWWICRHAAMGSLHSGQFMPVDRSLVLQPSQKPWHLAPAQTSGHKRLVKAIASDAVVHFTWHTIWEKPVAGAVRLHDDPASRGRVLANRTNAGATAAAAGWPVAGCGPDEHAHCPLTADACVTSTWYPPPQTADACVTSTWYLPPQTADACVTNKFQNKQPTPRKVTPFAQTTWNGPPLPDS